MNQIYLDTARLLTQVAPLKGLTRAQPDGAMLKCPHACELPALRWKLENLRAFQKRRPVDFERQAQALEAGL